MKLTTRCDSCGQDMKMNTLVSTRSELQMEKGDYFDINCQNCGSIQTKHVNDFNGGSKYETYDYWFCSIDNRWCCDVIYV